MIECVPNVSEGRRAVVLQSILAGLGRVRGLRLLDWSADSDHNRSVFTLAGDAESLLNGVLAIYAVAVPAIDLRVDRGAHPRIGAVDVVPFVPLSGTTMQTCVELARRAGQAIAERFDVPVFLYEFAATTPARRNLADIRRGEFEGLASKMAAAEWRADFGPRGPHPTAGASAVGARKVLIAYNVNLDSNRLEDAKAIARVIRERSGGLPALKAIGLHLPGRQIVQVSMNLTDFEQTNIAGAFAAVQREATRRGLRVLESELVGLAPSAAFGGASPDDLLFRNFRRDQILEVRLSEGPAS